MSVEKMNQKKFALPEGYFCANHCKDCRYLEIDNDFYNDGTRRCAWKGEWVRLGQEACSKFEY